MMIPRRQYAGRGVRGRAAKTGNGLKAQGDFRLALSVIGVFGAFGAKEGGERMRPGGDGVISRMTDQDRSFSDGSIRQMEA
jgi:hypothetical protein